MPIYTPRGLKIRLAPEHAFSLLARLSPRVSPFRVLKTTEGIEEIPTVVALIVGLLCFMQRIPSTEIAVYVFGATLASRLLTLYGVFVIPGLVSLGTFYSYISGFGIVLVVSVVTGYYFTGWQGVLAYFVGRYGAGFLAFLLEAVEMKRVFRLSGFAFTASERSFVNAYRLHASRIGATTDINVSEAEIRHGDWEDTLADFASEYPMVVRRFTHD